MTDFCALCADLVKQLEGWQCYASPDGPNAQVLDRARAALSQPEPEGPTREELENLADRYMVGDISTGGLSLEHVDFARAVLARFGRPAIKPVPVEERLPGPEDCDAEDECYWFDPAGTGAWYLDTYQGNYTHWLPHHALPVPGAEVLQ